MASFLSQNGAGAGGPGWSWRCLRRAGSAGPVAVNRAVDSQIKVVKDSGETSEVLAELKTLRTRLAVLRQAGLVPEHPAEVYDTAVLAAIQRVLPGVEVTRQGQGSRDIADFAVGYKGHQLFVETKWRSDPGRPFGGSTLPRLLENFPRDAKLLVVVSTSLLGHLDNLATPHGPTVGAS